MPTLLAICLVLALASMLLTAVTHVAVRTRLSSSRTPKTPSTPPLSVLKPLKGVDDDLYDNLASLAAQDYPDFELVLGCEDPSDAALLVARRLQREFPHVAIRIVAGAAQRGHNPKVNNLHMLSRAATHDWLLVSDASVRARPDYLRSMVSELADGVGLVSSMLVGSGELNLGARLDNLQMNSFVARGVCGAQMLASHPCVVGKSMLFRRSVLERLGGFALVENVLAEDYVMGQRFRDAGLGVVLSSHTLPSVCSKKSLSEFCARQVRWSQMRRHLAPLMYWGELLQSPTPWLLASFALVAGGAAAGNAGSLAVLLVAALSLRLLSDARLVRALRGEPLSPRDYFALVLKDVCFLWIWLRGGLERQVCWRGVSLRIGPGSVLSANVDEEQALEGA
ncbi:MAG: ceramide glucosyltransferase [Polyangiaceae bacterium]